MSDFSDRPFVAGSLTGVRVFDVDSLGRLRGVSVQTVFTPGENVAECQGGEFGSSIRRLQALTTTLYGPMTATFDPPALPPPPKPHQVAKASCTCGFYAYYDKGSNPHDGPGKVTALIEGYGVCAVGTRGFRAEKARLVALVAPTAKPPIWRRASPWWLSAFIGVVMLGFAVLQIIQQDWLFLAIDAGVAAANFATAVYAFRNQRKRDHLPASRRDLVARNYPDVPVYRSLKAALADHPLTPPPSPTPDAPDFWTRPA